MIQKTLLGCVKINVWLKIPSRRDGLFVAPDGSPGYEGNILSLSAVGTAQNLLFMSFFLSEPDLRLDQKGFFPCYFCLDTKVTKKSRPDRNLPEQSPKFLKKIFFDGISSTTLFRKISEWPEKKYKNFLRALRG